MRNDLEAVTKLLNIQTSKKRKKMADFNTEEMGQNGHQVCVIGGTESAGKTGQMEQEGRGR